MKKKRPTLKRWLLSVLTSLILIYVGSYYILSIGGRYEPAGIGLAGVKCYSWAPSGFVKEFKWQSRLMALYMPLYFLDDLYWHTPEKANSGLYPINEVKPGDIWQVYKANGFFDSKTTSQAPK
jgi:hypothetical protein